MPSLHFLLHEVPLTVHADGVDVARVLEEALTYKGARSTPASEEPGIAPAIELIFTTDGAVTPPPGMRRAGTADLGIVLSFDGGSYLLEGAAGTALIEPERARATGVLPPALLPSEAGHRAAPEAFSLVVMSLTLLLRARGLPALHTAALTHGDHAILISAHSGHGKSTTAFNLLRSGWTPVTDDAVLLRPTDEAVEALTYRRAFCISPAAVAHFPELARPSDAPPWPPALTDAAKWRVDVERVYGTPPAERCVPSLLLLPTITREARTRVEPASPKEAFFALLEQSVASVPAPPETSGALFQLLRRLVGQVEPYRLLAGRDLLDEPGRTAEIVGALLPSRPVHP